MRETITQARRGCGHCFLVLSTTSTPLNHTMTKNRSQRRSIVEVRCHPARRTFSRIWRHAVPVELAMLTCLFGPCQLGARATSTHLKLRPHGASSQSHLTTSFSTSAHLRLTGGACTVLSMFDHDRSGYFHTCTFRVAWYYKLVGEEHHDGTW